MARSKDGNEPSQVLHCVAGAFMSDHPTLVLIDVFAARLPNPQV
jgi:hypothetical protein